jgi:hypothetical protein
MYILYSQNAKPLTPRTSAESHSARGLGKIGVVLARPRQQVRRVANNGVLGFSLTVLNSCAASGTLTASRRAGEASAISTVKVTSMGHAHQYVDLGTLRHEDEDTTTCRAGGRGRLLRGLRLDVILRVYLPRVGGARGAWRPLGGGHRE